MAARKTHSNSDHRVAYFFGFVLLSLTGACLWLMSDIPPAPTQEVEREIPYEALVGK